MDFAVRRSEPDPRVVQPAGDRRWRRRDEPPPDDDRDRPTQPHEHEEGVGERLDLTA